MRPSRFTEQEIVQALKDVREGTPAVEMCRRMGVTQTTFYRWRARYCAQTPAAEAELRLLRDENQRLKQIVANLMLEREAGPDGARRK